MRTSESDLGGADSGQLGADDRGGPAVRRTVRLEAALVQRPQLPRQVPEVPSRAAHLRHVVCGPEWQNAVSLALAPEEGAVTLRKAGVLCCGIVTASLGLVSVVSVRVFVLSEAQNELFIPGRLREDFKVKNIFQLKTFAKKEK